MRLPILVALALTLGVGESAPGRQDEKPLIRAKPSDGRPGGYRMFEDYESSDPGKGKSYVDWTRRSDARSGIASTGAVQAASAGATSSEPVSNAGGEATGLLVLGAMTHAGQAYFAAPQRRGSAGEEADPDIAPLQMAAAAGWFAPSGGVGRSTATGGGSFSLLSGADPDPVTPNPPSAPAPLATAPTLAATHMPEPGTWLMMILGFAAVGASLRRRAARIVRFSPV